MAEESLAKDAPLTEANEPPKDVEAVSAPSKSEANISDTVEPLKGKDEQEKSLPPVTQTDTLELAARKRSTMERRRESLAGRSSTLKAKTDSLSSRAKLVLGSIISVKKTDTVGDLVGEKGKSARYMNTYKLDSGRPFHPETVRHILEEILMEALEGKYDEFKCPLKAKQASAAIRARVKELGFERYKLVCVVTIGEKHSQDVMIACRFLWDVVRDRYAMFSHETADMFGIALCFGLYYE